MSTILPAFFNPVFSLLSLGLGIGALLGYVAQRFQVTSDPVVERINDLLPQTQCGQCGYPGCKPYAEAIASGDAINKCPPGGDETIASLASLLNVRALPLDDALGTAGPRMVAVIREAECIGCAKCILACPVDAILGAPKFMHTVIASECTGCDLCIEPCPVDCIDMVPAEPTIPEVPSFLFSAADSQTIQACINCGLCVPECPVGIQPHLLYHACRTERWDSAQDLKLMHCIECSKCDAACPSQLPLTTSYQDAKEAVHHQQKDRERAVRAKRRFELHQLRTERFAAEEEARRQKRATLAKEREKVTASSIQAALARARARQQGKEQES